MRKAMFVGMAVLAIGASVYAQSGVAGKWTGETQGRGGPQTITLELAVKGTAVTGTITQGRQGAAEITNAKLVDPNTVTFSRMIQGRGREITLNYTGKVSGDEMTLSIELPGGGGRGPAGPITLKRM